MFVEAMYRNIFYLVFSQKFTKPKQFSQKFWFGCLPTDSKHSAREAGVAACYLRF